jgi:hypothetical protein
VAAAAAGRRHRQAHRPPERRRAEGLRRRDSSACGRGGGKRLTLTASPNVYATHSPTTFPFSPSFFFNACITVMIHPIILRPAFLCLESSTILGRQLQKTCRRRPQFHCRLLQLKLQILAM